MEISLIELLKIVEKRANDQEAGKMREGHLTLLRFTTHWKVMWGTPDLDGGKGREEIKTLKGFSTLEEALWHLIKNE